MTADDADSDWATLADAESPIRRTAVEARLAELATLPEDERLLRLLAMSRAELNLRDADRRSMARTRLIVLLQMPPRDAVLVATSTLSAHGRLPTGTSERLVAAMQEVGTQFSPEQVDRLRDLFPGVYGMRSMGQEGLIFDVQSSSAATPEVRPTASAPEAAIAERPVGVTIIALLHFVAGAVIVVTGLYAFVIGSDLGVGSAGSSAGLLLTLLGFAGIGVGFGLWTLRPWAWWLTILLQVAGGVGSIFGGAVVYVVIGLVTIGYLLTPPIRRAFGIRF